MATYTPNYTVSNPEDNIFHNVYFSMYASVLMGYLVSKTRTSVTGKGRLWQEAVLSYFQVLSYNLHKESDNKIGNVRVTWRSVRVTTVAVKKQ
jgi:hypothetical protein